MAKRKFRFDEGGDVMEAMNASEDAQSIARSMEAGPKNEPTPKAEKSKKRVVSKKELEESGLTLREFLNRERGLKSRREKDPTAGDSPDREAQEAADAIDALRDMRTPRFTPPASAPKQTTQKPKSKVLMPDRPDNSFPGAKFASGGSVSSASRRADGIAAKGKTRCKMR